MPSDQNANGHLPLPEVNPFTVGHCENASPRLHSTLEGHVIPLTPFILKTNHTTAFVGKFEIVAIRGFVASPFWFTRQTYPSEKLHVKPPEPFRFTELTVVAKAEVMGNGVVNVELKFAPDGVVRKVPTLVPRPVIPPTATAEAVEAFPVTLPVRFPENVPVVVPGRVGFVGMEIVQLPEVVIGEVPVTVS